MPAEAGAAAPPAAAAGRHSSTLIDIRAVIYDLDGTLLDTETLSTEATQAVVGRFGATFTWYVGSIEVDACHACLPVNRHIHTQRGRRIDGTIEMRLTTALPLRVGRREIKKRILGMRGEEWGRIVVDGKYASESLSLSMCGWWANGRLGIKYLSATKKLCLISTPTRKHMQQS